MKKIIINNLTEVKNLAIKTAENFAGGNVVALIGNLGAGKTTFTQFLAKALGVTQTVNSPTFNIIKTYKIKNNKSCPPASKLPIKSFTHVDAYRLRSVEDLRVIGVEEYFNDKNNITIIEWADKVQTILPKNATVIKISLMKNGQRRFEIK